MNCKARMASAAGSSFITRPPKESPHAAVATQTGVSASTSQHCITNLRGVAAMVLVISHRLFLPGRNPREALREVFFLGVGKSNSRVGIGDDEVQFARKRNARRRLASRASAGKELRSWSLSPGMGRLLSRTWLRSRRYQMLLRHVRQRNFLQVFAAWSHYDQ